VEKRTGGRSAPTTVNSSVRTREYPTTAEIERLMAAARKSSRYGHRDATMILIGYRHGLRASELCDLQWSQVELATGRLHVRRAKNGSPSVHPMQGDEIRALRRLQREQGASSHVFMTERDGPMTPKARDNPALRHAPAIWVEKGSGTTGPASAPTLSMSQLLRWKWKSEKPIATDIRNSELPSERLSRCGP
jgi:integrase